MIITIISWIYYTILCFAIGLGVQGLLKKIYKIENFRFISTIITGIIAITVYAEIFSIVYKVGMVAHLLLLLVSIAFLFLFRQNVLILLKGVRKSFLRWDTLFYFALILLVAFFTSRGVFHTDTNIYHAGNIRIYEDYGLIKGMGNLQLHYAYNSAYLAFAAIMSLRFLLPFSLHTTTGFIEVLLCIYACHGLKNFWTRQNHLADMGRVALLIYTIVNITGSQSPATDYGTMFLSLYLICAWLDNMENDRNADQYTILSIGTLFVATMKLSAASMVLLALYPGILMIKKNDWKKLLISIIMGLIVFLPFLIRNFLISGWLFYPFESIDIFNVVWKIPSDYLLVDAAQIKVWGRCLYDVSLVDMPVTQWLPIWWEKQARYDQMLLYGNMLGLAFILFNLIKNIIQRRKITIDYVILLVSLLCSALLWFFTAPFIRYGLGFLLIIPLIGIGEWFEEKRKGFYSLVGGTFVLLICLCFFSYIDNYVTDDGVFLKHHLKDPYYVTQVPYDTADTKVDNCNGNLIYSSIDGIVNSYYYTPNTCYGGMWERSELIGDNIQDGFKAKD